MKLDVAAVKQIFNAKALATDGLTLGQIPDNTLAIIDESTGLSESSMLPDEFIIAGKVNGKVYTSIRTIKKSSMIDLQVSEQRAGTNEAWVGTLNSCGCAAPVTLTINIDEASLLLRDGLTWSHRDFVVEVPTEELTCMCSCDGTYKVYENNVMTALLHKAILRKDSPFYTSRVIFDYTSMNIPTGSAYPGSPTEGMLFLKSDVSQFAVYVDGNWHLFASDLGEILDVDSFVELMKGINTDPNATVEGPMLSLLLEGKSQPMPAYKDLEPNYIYPRGVRLQPALAVGKGNNVFHTPFRKAVSVVYPIGDGYDMRAEEFASMGYYTNMQNPVLCGPFTDPDLIYQFENFKTYDAITFAQLADKTKKNDGDKGLINVTIATEDPGVLSSLRSLFNV